MNDSSINTIRLFELLHYLMLDEYYRSLQLPPDDPPPDEPIAIESSANKESAVAGKTGIAHHVDQPIDTEQEVKEDDESKGETARIEKVDNSILVKDLISGIYQQHKENSHIAKFSVHFSRQPCSNEPYRELIYLWILMGLPVYLNNEPGKKLKADVGNRKIFPIDGQKWCFNLSENWTIDVLIKKEELKTFLRSINAPLPVHYFNGEADNTRNKNQFSEKEYQRKVYNMTELLPALEDKLTELEQVPAQGMKEWEAKGSRVDELKRKIKSIREGGFDRKDEPFQVRQDRLKEWLDEEIRLRGPRSAKRRVADREGITRQTLDGILNRKRQ